MNENQRDNEINIDMDILDLCRPSEHELTVFKLMRNMEYGEIRIVIRNSHVVQIEEKKSIKI